MCKMCARDLKEIGSDAEQARAASPPVPKKRLVFNQLRGLKTKHNLSTDPTHPNIQKEVEYQPDLLAVSTQYAKLSLVVASDLYQRFRKSHAFSVVTRTTQPLHLLLGALVLCAWFSARGSADTGSLRLWKALYVSGIAIHIGAQIWMSLVSGIVLYFSIPRHEFGRVQTVLFPTYFAFNATVCFIALLAYFKIQCISRFQSTSWLQITLLLVTFLIEASVRLYFVKPMLKMKHMKTQMEESAGGGQEVGKLVLGELAHCPRYMKILKAFRGYHSTVAMGNMISLGCSIYSIMIVVDSVCV